MKASVYFNIRRKVFSVKRGGRVVARRARLYMTGCRFKVQEAGRQRVLKTKKKNVHAFVEGEIVRGFCRAEAGCPVTYNPYKHKTFVRQRRKTPVHAADLVLLDVVAGKARIQTWAAN